MLFVPIQVLRTTPAEFVKGSLQQESHQDHDLIQDEILDRDVKRAGKSAPCSALNSLDNSAEFVPDHAARSDSGSCSDAKLNF